MPINDSPPPTVCVGLCQILTHPWDVAGNFDRTMAALREGAKQGAELLITPECVLHGYAFDEQLDLATRTAAVAESIDSARIVAVRDLARELSVDIVFGFAEKSGSLLHNSAIFIARDGNILFNYRKVHCRNFEAAGCGGFFTPGSEFHVVLRQYRNGSFNIGAMICFDREIPEAARCLRAAGADFIACPLATDTFDPYARDAATNELITRARAAENELCIAVVNHAGRFNGGSFVVGPMGEMTCRLDEKPSVYVVDVPVDAARRMHTETHGWMGWGYRRGDVYGRYLK